MNLRCVRCRTPLGPAARFCAECGASAPERTAALVGAGACPGCGVVGPPTATTCEVCASFC